MFVSVIPTRAFGRKIPAADRRRHSVGLATRQVTAGIRTTIALQALGQDGRPLLPDLYDPKLTSCSGRCMVFVGMEYVGQAWVAQEWTCEMMNDEDVAGFE